MNPNTCESTLLKIWLTALLLIPVMFGVLFHWRPIAFNCIGSILLPLGFTDARSSIVGLGAFLMALSIIVNVLTFPILRKHARKLSQDERKLHPKIHFSIARSWGVLEPRARRRIDILQYVLVCLMLTGMLFVYIGNIHME